MTRRMIPLLLVSALLVAGLAFPPSAGAAPVLAPVTCAPTAPPTPKGSVAIQILPFLPPLVIPLNQLGQPIADALAGTELPLPMPFDLSATEEIAPGGTVDYATDISFDLGDGLVDVVDAVRDGIAAAGYPELAETFRLEAVLEDLTIAFPHPTGTTGTGTPSATGATGVAAAHKGGALEVEVPEFVISTDSGIDPLDAHVAWSVLDGGTTPPATLVQTLGDIEYDFDFEVGGTIPTELIEAFLPDLGFPLPDQLPLTAGATGPWRCTPDDPDTALAETLVVGEEPPAEPSRLRVTTDPALPAPIIVDGLPRDDWGLDWMAIEPGTHEVCFGAVNGFAAPPCQEVEVPEGGTGTVVGQFTPLGSLRVLTSPPVLATIYLDGRPVNESGLWTYIEPGTYEVCFGAVPGQAAPPCQDAVVEAGETALITGEYTPDAEAPGYPEGRGALRVVTEPAVPSRIFIDGELANTWSVDWVQLDPGEYEVCFEPVLFATAPPCETAVVEADQTTVVEGAFELHGFLQITTEPPVPANLLVDGVDTDAWGVWTSRPPGDYEVCFGALFGLIEPPCQSVSVVAGETTSVNGVYG